MKSAIEIRGTVILGAGAMDIDFKPSVSGRLARRIFNLEHGVQQVIESHKNLSSKA
jgi:hypothetical protein